MRRGAGVLVVIALCGVALGGAASAQLTRKEVATLPAVTRVQSVQRRTDVELAGYAPYFGGSSAEKAAELQKLLQKELGAVGIDVDPAKVADLANGIVRGGASGVAIAFVVATTLADASVIASANALDGGAEPPDGGARSGGDPAYRARAKERLASVGLTKATPQVVEGYLPQPGAVTFASSDFEALGKLAPSDAIARLRETADKRFAAYVARLSAR